MSFHPRPLPNPTTFILSHSSLRNPDRSKCAAESLRSGLFSEKVKHYSTHAACALPVAILAAMVWTVAAFIYEQARAGRIQ
jgi:ABC-type thiamin/hydroxymethylpyrimidine transport system permease subunit